MNTAFRWFPQQISSYPCRILGFYIV